MHLFASESCSLCSSSDGTMVSWGGTTKLEAMVSMDISDKFADTSGSCIVELMLRNSDQLYLYYDGLTRPR